VVVCGATDDNDDDNKSSKCMNECELSLIYNISPLTFVLRDKVLGLTDILSEVQTPHHNSNPATRKPFLVRHMTLHRAFILTLYTGIQTPKAEFEDK